MIGRSLMAVAVALACVGPVFAQEDDEEEFAELLDVLSEETEVATKTRMNSDYVPGIVTVLDAQNMAAMGARTVWDALSFVPGVEAWLDAVGTPTVTVRGIPFPFNSGSIAVLIDSVPIAAEAAGINGAALLMPIEQVERLEFVRGPGSVIYGDYAFQGLLNIVTRERGTRLDVVEGEDEGEERSGNLRASAEGNGWRVHGQFAAYDSDDTRVPDPRAADEDRRYATFGLHVGGFALRAFGVERELASTDTRNALVFDERSRALDARYLHVFSPELEATVRGNYLSNDLVTGAIEFDGGHAKFGADVLWRGAGTWVAGVEYTRAEIDSALQRAQPVPGQPPVAPTLLRERERTVRSAYVQGQFSLSDALSTTLGARYDDNESIGSRFTPRASLVWRAAENHILKAQYAEGFRSPTFFELYSNPTQPPLDFEVNQTAEINYVYQQPNTTARVTLYRSRIDEMVFRDFARQRFGNVGRAESDGIELEWNRQFGETVRLDAALGWNDSAHNRNVTLVDEEITAAADWVGNLGMLWTPRSDTAVGMRWMRAAGRVDPYNRVDLSYTRRHVVWDGLELQLGLQNALSERIVYLFPAPTGDRPTPYDGRTLFARLSWEWR